MEINFISNLIIKNEVMIYFMTSLVYLLYKSTVLYKQNFIIVKYFQT